MNIIDLNEKIMRAFQSNGVLLNIYSLEGINPFNKNRVITQLPNNTSCLAISPFNNCYTEFSIYDSEEEFNKKIDNFKHTVVSRFLDDINNNCISINLDYIPYFLFQALAKILNKSAITYADHIEIDGKPYYFLIDSFKAIILNLSKK